MCMCAWLWGFGDKAFIDVSKEVIQSGADCAWEALDACSCLRMLLWGFRIWPTRADLRVLFQYPQWKLLLPLPPPPLLRSQPSWLAPKALGVRVIHLINKVFPLSFKETLSGAHVALINPLTLTYRQYVQDSGPDSYPTRIWLKSNMVLYSIHIIIRLQPKYKHTWTRLVPDSAKLHRD